MFVSIWNYFTGYVIVEVSGYTLEKFINLALKEKIDFWDVSRTDQKIYFKTSVDNFKRLKDAARKTRCRMKIVRKCGLPFTAFRYRRRKLLVCGTIIFAAILYVMSSFVWLVEVDGASRLQETDLITTLEQNGFTSGKMKRGLDLRAAEQCLVNAYSDIIWAGVKFEGTKLVVQVTESVPKPAMYEKSVPTHLLAKRDALITYIATDKGIPQVKKGDTVKKGEILVSGEMILQDEQASVRYTHSDAKIIGKTCYTLKGTLPSRQIKKVYTDEVKKNYRIRLFNTMIPLYVGEPQYTHYDTLVTIKQFKITELFPLPFYFEKTEYVAYDPVQVEVPLEDAKDRLQGKLYDELLKQIGTEGKVLYYEVNYTQEEDNLVAILNAVVEEQIAEAVPVTIGQSSPEENKPEGVNP
ncbi:MAG: sporulation protein YqfD [Cellulosilyticaceae bacterium]